jgi:hypothetical protein
MIKDLFRVLLTSQDVSSYNACGILEWEGEFKHIPHRYFDCIINNMYSLPTIAKGSFIVINFKKNYTRGRREDM